jgi:hypothetical protein
MPNRLKCPVCGERCEGVGEVLDVDLPKIPTNLICCECGAFRGIAWPIQCTVAPGRSHVEFRGRGRMDQHHEAHGDR